MARERKRHVKSKEGAAQDAPPTMPVGGPCFVRQDVEHHLRLELFIRALARDLARIDHDRDQA